MRKDGRRPLRHSKLRSVHQRWAEIDITTATVKLKVTLDCIHRRCITDPGKHQSKDSL
jgi:hypothetical protein